MGKTPAGQTRQQVLAFVRQRLLAGEPPTVREVQHAFKFRSPQTAREHLEGLVDAGMLGKESGKSRGYRLPATARGRASIPQVLVPLVGHVAAGSPSLATEDVDEYITVRSRTPAGSLFALRVRGESMRDAGILSGDVVIVHRQARADSGDIVVALIGDEATVKRLRVHRGRAELHPENPDFQPIPLDREDARLLGRVIEVRRTLG